MTDFIINPCSSCIKKLDSENCDVNEINQCCYETLNAFEGSGSINSLRNTVAAKNCVECVQRIIKKSGKDIRKLKIEPPVLWGNSPHFFPSLLNDMKDIEKACKECNKMCLDTNYPNVCMDNCNTDMNAVEIYGRNNEEVESGEDEVEEDEVESSEDEVEEDECDNNLIVYCAFAFAVILLFVFLTRDK